ncbi:DUF4397 domain-containing protein [Corallococcus llansteffanensis]|uniref:DUF4397 domain-containing protein n=1 Tax=Corallococcus llansteffanensis TaxID=2316731 RepID=A0A3A8P8U9_9BACT|nr:DUF4397 domain-containing protein [Corallococcus llansteffanensis]RKH49885.1 DUF4397 domain-containing protein [Corallococcus llansteffanensis]
MAWMRGKTLLVVALTSLGALAPACGGGDADDPGSDPTQDGPVLVPTTTAQLRLVQAAPGAPAMDVYLAGNPTPVARAVAYGATTPYLTREPGAVTVELRPAGAAPGSPAFASTPVRLDAGTRWTVVAAGQAGSTDSNAALRTLLLRDNTVPADQGQARVRVVHAGADAPTVGVDLGNDGSVEVASLGRFQDSGEQALVVPSGAALQVGLVTGNAGKVLTSFTVPALGSGTDTLIVATGLVSEPARAGDSFSLLTAGRDGTLAILRQNPTLYVLNASPDAPALDLFTRDLELSDALPYGALSTSLQVPPGTYALDFFASTPGASRPTTAPVASATTPLLVPGERYLMVAAGYLAPSSPSMPAFTVLPLTERFANDPSNLRLRWVHAASDAPVVDVGPLGSERRVLPDAPFLGVPFASATAPDGLPLPSGGTLTLGVVPSDDANRSPRARFNVTPRPDTRVFAVATDLPGAAPGAWDLQLLLVDTTRTPWTVSAQPREP